MKKILLLISAILIALPSMVKAQDFPNSYTVTYEGGDEIIIAWPGSEYVSFMGGYAGVYLQQADGTQIDLEYGTKDDGKNFALYWGDDASGLEFYLGGLNLTEGTKYTLHVPQGFIEVDDADW